jgi:anti-anti-sigma factor
LPGSSRIGAFGSDVLAVRTKKPSMSSTLQPLVVSAVPDRERVHLLVAGELDLATVPRLREELDTLFDVGWPHVVVDLRETTFMDSSGVHALVDARHRAQEQAARMLVVTEPGPVRRTLELTGAHTLLDLA